MKQSHPAERDQGAKTRKEEPPSFLCASKTFASLRETLLSVRALFHSFKGQSAAGNRCASS